GPHIRSRHHTQTRPTQAAPRCVAPAHRVVTWPPCASAHLDLVLVTPCGLDLPAARRETNLLFSSQDWFRELFVPAVAHSSGREPSCENDEDERPKARVFDSAPRITPAALDTPKGSR
ncbi:hypothetical protein HK405_003287, partial [Cladochytrium tenue]